MLTELGPQAFVEESDLRERKRPRVRKARIVPADLQEHLSVNHREGVPVAPRLAVWSEPLVGTVSHERRPDRQPPKKRFVIARQTSRSRFFIFENLALVCLLIAAITANSFAISAFFLR